MFTKEDLRDGFTAAVLIGSPIIIVFVITQIF